MNDFNDDLPQHESMHNRSKIHRRHKFWRKRPQCPESGKRTLERKAAETKRLGILKSGKRKYVRIYHCKHCSFWHLTTKPQRKS
jgi:hypothetical protein